MEWHQLYNEDKEPTIKEIQDYIQGKGGILLADLLDYVMLNYRIKPKLNYSCCSLKKGWNIKLGKSGKSVGTLYPEEDSFSVFIVINYSLDNVLNEKLNYLNDKIRNQYTNATDYMKIGKWMMLKIENESDLASYKILIDLKLQPLYI